MTRIPWLPSNVLLTLTLNPDGKLTVSNSITQTISGSCLPLHKPEPQDTSAEHKSVGNVAVWILIYAELTEFALFFIVFLIARSHNPEMFSAGPGRLNTLAGMLNTLTLITSSFFVAKAVAAIKKGQRQTCQKWLWLTLLAGATYCGIKTWEYFWNEAAGFDLRTNLFYSLYYYLTFNHLLHVLIGMCTILWVTLNSYFDAYSANNNEGLESAALYWHMIDMVWIIIFPLLYLL